jgi:hypothetical protein
MNPGIADNMIRRPCIPRDVLVIYGAGRRLSCMERERSKRYRNR